MARKWIYGVATLALAAGVKTAFGFCGFYVAKADTKLFNKASQVALVRLDDKTVMTMANDFQGNPKEFAVVIPVPTKIERGQIHVAEKALIDHVDAYSAPCLVEYYDADPCAPMPVEAPMSGSAGGWAMDAVNVQSRAKSHGVTVEARMEDVLAVLDSLKIRRCTVLR